ncbi:hypothetical protein EDD22DRAFT_958220 [Suillus occidentalis]|nr:hypothetical protein EDD22DRAFT_958220 [Suillus occidentalis]
MADGPGLVYWDGMVGHSGKNGCRLYCGVQGRRKTRGTRYYPALLKPTDQSVIGSNHPDIDVFKIPLGGSDDYKTNLMRLVASPNQRQYDIRKTETGITKPPLILGLRPSCTLGVPICMTTDIMHLAANLSDLLLSLWRGTLDCGPSDDIETWDWAVLMDEDAWTIHGAAVENAGPYLPTSFDRKPCNISEKLNTGYKTWEFQLYMFGLAPALLYDILPRKYWSNYCQLVRGFQLMCQLRITAQELVHAQALLCCWERDFELLYYRRREDRIHFIRPSVHQTNHLVSETVCKGPSICYAQWTMEQTIGNLGQEICQPSNPFANLSQEGVRRCRVNTLLSIMPELDNSCQGHPNGSVDLGDGRNTNKQIARSAWRETTKAPEQVRMSRNVKFKVGGQFRFGEVRYFTRLAVEAEDANEDGDNEDNWRFLDVAVIQAYSLPDKALLQLSSQMVTSCTRSEQVLAIDVKDIVSVIAMIPHKPKLPSGLTEDRFFMVEKPCLDVSDLGVRYSAYHDKDNEDNADDTRIE